MFVEYVPVYAVANAVDCVVGKVLCQWIDEVDSALQTAGTTGTAGRSPGEVVQAVLTVVHHSHPTAVQQRIQEGNKDPGTACL